MIPRSSDRPRPGLRVRESARAHSTRQSVLQHAQCSTFHLDRALLPCPAERPASAPRLFLRHPAAPTPACRCLREHGLPCRKLRASISVDRVSFAAAPPSLSPPPVSFSSTQRLFLSLSLSPPPCRFSTRHPQHARAHGAAPRTRARSTREQYPALANAAPLPAASLRVPCGCPRGVRVASHSDR
jgi:hypothetical protein